MRLGLTFFRASGVNHGGLLNVEKLRTKYPEPFPPVITMPKFKGIFGTGHRHVMSSKIVAEIYLSWCSEYINKTPTIRNARFIELLEFSSEINGIIGIFIWSIHTINIVLVLLAVDKRSMEDRQLECLGFRRRPSTYQRPLSLQQDVKWLWLRFRSWC